MAFEEFGRPRAGAGGRRLKPRLEGVPPRSPPARTGETRVTPKGAGLRDAPTRRPLAHGLCYGHGRQCGGDARHDRAGRDRRMLPILLAVGRMVASALVGYVC